MIESIFLSEDDWRALDKWKVRCGNSEAFKRDVPKSPETVCGFCGLPESESNPLEAAHRIPAKAVRKFGLSPAFTSRAENFMWAHEKDCNRSVEYNDRQIARILINQYGVTAIPSYLSKDTLALWREVSKETVAMRPHGEPVDEEPKKLFSGYVHTGESKLEVRKNERTDARPVTNLPSKLDINKEGPSEIHHVKTVPGPMSVERRTGQKLTTTTQIPESSIPRKSRSSREEVKEHDRS